MLNFARVMLGSQNSGFFLSRPHTSLPTRLWRLAASVPSCHILSLPFTLHLHHTQCTRPSHAWDIEFLLPLDVAPMLGTRRWKGMRDFFCNQFHLMGIGLNRSSFGIPKQERNQPALWASHLYIYIYTRIYIYIVPCLFEGVEGILRSMIEKLKA